MIYCGQEILEAVKSMQLASIPDIWQQFWSSAHSVDNSEYDVLFIVTSSMVRCEVLQSACTSVVYGGCMYLYIFVSMCLHVCERNSKPDEQSSSDFGILCIWSCLSSLAAW